MMKNRGCDDVSKNEKQMMYIYIYIYIYVYIYVEHCKTIINVICLLPVASEELACDLELLLVTAEAVLARV